MTTAELAIVVTGGVSVFVPAGTAIVEWQRDKRRHRHERALRDRDALRDRLDGVAEAMETAARAEGALFGTFLQQGPEGHDLGVRVAEAFKGIHDARLAIAKLALWVDLSTGAGAHAREYLRLVDEIVCEVDTACALRRIPDNFSYDEVDKKRAVMADEWSEFLKAARADVGASLD